MKVKEKSLRDVFGPDAEGFIGWLDKNCDCCRDRYCELYNQLMQDYSRDAGESEAEKSIWPSGRAEKPQRCIKWKREK